MRLPTPAPIAVEQPPLHVRFLTRVCVNMRGVVALTAQNGETPLHLAARACHHDTATLLINSGADLMLRTKSVRAMHPMKTITPLLCLHSYFSCVGWCCLLFGFWHVRRVTWPCTWLLSLVPSWWLLKWWTGVSPCTNAKPRDAPCWRLHVRTVTIGWRQTFWASKHVDEKLRSVRVCVG